MEEIADRFAGYFAERADGVSEVEVADIARIHGGASRETFRLRVRYRQDGEARERGLILRRDPVGSLIDTERELEFNAYAAFYPTSVPVPEPLFLETDEKWLDRPFFVMEQIEGCEAASPFRDDPYGENAEALGTQFWRILGEIARQDPAGLGLADTMEMPVPDACWQKELGYWEGVIDEDEIAPQPIARAAIRWLKRNPPPPAQKLSVIHGDYRTGNFLFDGEGTIRAVLDWEMCHLGDPLEDLAWALDPLWAYGRPERPGGMIERGRAIALWEEASGLKADPEALSWWEIFASLKGLAIWISSSKEYADGENQDPVLAVSGWYCTSVHNEVLAERLSALAGGKRERSAA